MTHILSIWFISYLIRKIVPIMYIPEKIILKVFYTDCVGVKVPGGSGGIVVVLDS